MSQHATDSDEDDEKETLDERFERLAPEGWEHKPEKAYPCSWFEKGKYAIKIDWGEEVQFWSDGEYGWREISSVQVPQPAAYALGILLWDERGRFDD